MKELRKIIGILIVVTGLAGYLGCASHEAGFRTTKDDGAHKDHTYRLQKRHPTRGYRRPSH